jgi:methylmalonyl-CoA mutase
LLFLSSRVYTRIVVVKIVNTVIIFQREGSCLIQQTMDINQMKNASFAPSSNEDWMEVAEASLKGKKLESLNRSTYENIILKPLYSAVDEKEAATSFPGVSNYRRGLYALGYHSKPWMVAQNIPYQTVRELMDKLSSALKRGQSALSFILMKEIFDKPEEIETLLSGLTTNAPFAIETNGFQKSFLPYVISASSKGDASGYIAEDPISCLVERGALPYSLEQYLNSWAKTIHSAAEKLPNVKTVLINTTPYHNGGANAVQELAAALATGVYYLEELKTRSLEKDTLFEKFIFKFQVGANFFMELAKLRAVRVLWDKIGEAYGVGADKRGMTIIAETSSFNKTLYDHHVNILRSGNEAFTAVLGGVQYLQVHSFNELEGATPLAERLARNTQLILKEEAFLQNIVDPAGGSWYIESLTNELVSKAWEFFLTIEDKGGILKVLESNWLQAEISDVFSKRQKDIYTRKQSIVGTNVYADLQETSKELADNKLTSLNNSQEETYHSIQPIRQQRLSAPYEFLRGRAQRLKNNRVGLICIGELKDYKARADFMTGFLAAGGLVSVKGENVSNAAEAEAFVKESGLRHYVLCSSNEIYNEKGMEILKYLKTNKKDCYIYLAGLPGKDSQNEWLTFGIREFVHIQTNCYEFNHSIMTELEGGEGA